MPLKQNISGTWKDLTCWINVSGTWKQATVWKNVSGTWKQITSSLSASLPTDIAAGDFTFYPTGAFAQLAVMGGGTWEATNGGSGTWKNSGSGGDYECRLSGSGIYTLSGDATGSWLRLNVSRTWSYSTSGSTSEYKSWSGTLEIRPYGGGTVLASANVTIDATTEY